MKKLCICIPTYNRSKCIEHILRSYLEWIKEHDIDLYIFDSSSDGKTAIYVDEYMPSYGGHLFYELETNYPDKTTDLKVFRLFDKLQEKYEYIHLSGDGLVIDINKYINLLKNPIMEDYDIIHFNSWLDRNEIIYSSGHDFAKDNGWYATYYGSTVISSKVIKRANYAKLVEQYRNTGFMYWYGMLNAVAEDNQKIVAFKEFPLLNNPFKSTNTSHQPGRFVTFWIVSWNQVIDALPAHYDDIKSKIKKDIGKNLKLYSYRNLLNLRASGNLEYRVIKEQKQLVKKVTDVSIGRLIVISFVPKKLASLVMLIGRKIKSVNIKRRS